MPLSPAQSTRSIITLQVTIVFSVDPTTAVPGQRIWFTGNISPPVLAGVTTSIEILGSDGIWYQVAETPNSPEGYFSEEWIVPFSSHGKTPCQTWKFRAVSQGGAGEISGTKELTVPFSVRIRDFAAPASVPVGQPFTVEGYLEYESASGIWSALEGHTLGLFYNGTSLGLVTTEPDGHFIKTDCIIPTAGTYTLEANFTGQILGLRLTVFGDSKPTLAIAAVLVGLLILAIKGR